VRASGTALWLIVSAVSSSVAQTKAPNSVPVPSRPVTLFLEAGLVTTALDAGVARRQGMGERGFGLAVGFGLESRAGFAFSAVVSAMGFRDDSAFSQSTTGGTKTSGVSIIEYGARVGTRGVSARLGGARAWRLRAGLGAGYVAYQGGRSISNCVNCSSEDLRVAGGVFVEPAVGVSWQGGQRESVVTVAVRRYSGGAEARSGVLVTYRMYQPRR